MECFEPALVGPFFSDRLKLHPSADFRGVMWLPDDRVIAAAGTPGMDDVAVAVGYNTFVGKTCCMHVVVQRPELLNRRMVRAAFEFPFNTCGCVAVLAPVDSLNSAALEFDRRLGFKPLAHIEGGGLEADLELLIMTRADCRWLRLH
jgi:hypothetical protein